MRINFALNDAIRGPCDTSYAKSTRAAFRRARSYPEPKLLRALMHRTKKNAIEYFMLGIAGDGQTFRAAQGWQRRSRSLGAVSSVSLPSSPWPRNSAALNRNPLRRHRGLHFRRRPRAAPRRRVSAREEPRLHVLPAPEAAPFLTLPAAVYAPLPGAVIVGVAHCVPP